MKMLTEINGEVCIITLEGEIDSLCAGEIKDLIQKQVECKVYNIVIDLTGVKFMDSAGLGVLVSGLKLCSKNGGNLVLTGLSENVRELFHITRLETVFKLFTDQSDAVSEFDTMSA